MTTAQSDIPNKSELGFGGTWQVEGPEALGQFITGNVSDRLLQVSIEIAAELWTTRRRLARIEGQLTNNGTISDPESDPAAFSPEERSERDQFINRIFNNFLL